MTATLVPLPLSWERDRAVTRALALRRRRVSVSGARDRVYVAMETRRTALFIVGEVCAQEV